MSKPFSELTKDFSLWRKFKIWVERQKILWEIRKKDKLRMAFLEELQKIDAEY